MIESFFQSILDIHCPGSALRQYRTVGGGCINNTVRLESDRASFFIKYNQSAPKELFIAEAVGLNLLKDSGTIRVPHILGEGTIKNTPYLLLEWLDGGISSPSFWELFGMRLADLHQVQATQYGLSTDNFIGRLPQSNRQVDNWFDFFIQERLMPQLKLASERNLIDQQLRARFDKLFSKLPDLIPEEKPSLLHGDLWSGNFLVDSNSEPALIDPAVYYGHRETELAFTYLFGGFDDRFYQSYSERFPLQPHFEDRIDLHNLYPLLVHVNLFGTSYLSGIMQTLARHS